VHQCNKRISGITWSITIQTRIVAQNIATRNLIGAITDYVLSLWLFVDIDSAVETLHRVVMCNIANVSEVRADSIFGV
jgi:hypothetical protein